jgi:hypothetical protein
VVMKKSPPSDPPPDPIGVAPGSARLPKRTRWYAVSVVIDSEACSAVRALRGTRWLSSEAPRFPVPECDAFSCGCRYKHYNDRRGKAQRYRDREGRPSAYAGPERRSASRGRRSDDS